MSFMIRFLDIVNIHGVDSYILTKNDGQVLSHNVHEPERLSVTVSTAGQLCRESGDLAGLSGFRYLILNRDTEKPLIIISAGNYFVGIIARASDSVSEMIHSVLSFLKQIISEQKK